MDTITLQDIQTLARQESGRLRHYFIGVEHLFIALTELDGGLTYAVLEQHGLAPRFVRYSIRETIGRFESRRYWPGFPLTPRAVHVLDLAREYAGPEAEITERALLLAILSENDSVAIRVLREVGVDPAALYQTAQTWETPVRAQRPEAVISGEVQLEAEQKRVLQLMFRDYSEVHIVRELDGGHSGARVLLVRPSQAQRKHAPVVVKLDERHRVLYERRRYDQYVKDILPATAARLLDTPVVPDHSSWGGLKYTFVGGLEDTDPVSLRQLARRRGADGAETVSTLLHTLFDVFGPAWWMQRQHYRFGVWREYEHVLPPALVVEVTPDITLSGTAHILTPLGTWSRTHKVMPGEIVALNGLAVQKIDVEHDVLHLAAGTQPEAINRSGKVEVRGLGVGRTSYYRGEIIDQIVGRVISTREDLLMRTVQGLEPDFDFNVDRIPSGYAGLPSLPNPLHELIGLLDRHVNGYLSTIHGDLNLGNILIGPRGDAWLIDFAWTREGHTLFDWSLLEVNYLVEVVAPLAQPGWQGAWNVLARLDALNRGEDRVLRDSDPVSQSLKVVKALRQIVGECMVARERQDEYFTAIAMQALRVMDWRGMSLDGRRLALLLAALALDSVHLSSDGGTDTMSDNKTDLGFRS